MTLPYTNFRILDYLRKFAAKKGTTMRCLRDARILRLGLCLLVAFIGMFAVYGVVCPLLWPYRDHPMVWFLLAFLSGGHLEEILQEIGTPL